MNDDIQIPDYLKELMDSGKVNNEVDILDVQSGGVPRLSTKGKVFRIKDGDNEIKLGNSIDVIILSVTPKIGLAHTYYADGYTVGASAPPDCSSFNGVTPDEHIQFPVNDTCARCPKQVWGSAVSMNNGKAKACKDSKHLYVALAKDFSEGNNYIVYLLSVTVNSLKAYSNYIKTLKVSNIPSPEFVITRISMDDEASVPKLNFEVMSVLNEDIGTRSFIKHKELDDEFSVLSTKKLESKPIRQVNPPSNDFEKDIPIFIDEGDDADDNLANLVDTF